jgi:Rieske Fe-S protein
MATRRSFLLVAVGTALAALSSVAGAALAFVLAPLRRGEAHEAAAVDLGASSAFDVVRSGTSRVEEIMVERNLEDAYMTRRVKERFAVIADASAPSGLAALDTTCTHLGCAVSWNAARGQFLCPCHGGVYGPSGAVIAGPPPGPLVRLPIVLSGGHAWLDAAALDA